MHIFPYHLVFTVIPFLAAKHFTMRMWGNVCRLPPKSGVKADAQHSPQCKQGSDEHPCLSVVVPLLRVPLRAELTRGVTATGCDLCRPSPFLLRCLCLSSSASVSSVPGFVPWLRLAWGVRHCWLDRMTFACPYTDKTVSTGLKERLWGQASLGSNMALPLTGWVDLSKLFNLPEFEFIKRRIISTYWSYCEDEMKYLSRALHRIKHIVRAQ